MMFENGKAAFFDFDGEHYFSPIRSRRWNVQGVRGEIQNDTICYMNEKNQPVTEKMFREDDGVNNIDGWSHMYISFKGNRIYENPFPGLRINDDEIENLANLTMEYPVDMRFIELMPIQDHDEFGEEAYVPYSRVLERLPEALPVAKDGGVAKLYRLPGAKGNIGLISPISAHFCGECNRLRLTADGKLKPCLHAPDEYSIKGLDREGMKAVFEQAIWNKPAWHGDLDAINRSKAGRNMNEIGG